VYSYCIICIDKKEEDNGEKYIFSWRDIEYK
jgi:hypothetical protein